MRRDISWGAFSFYDWLPLLSRKWWPHFHNFNHFWQRLISDWGQWHLHGFLAALPGFPLQRYLDNFFDDLFLRYHHFLLYRCHKWDKHFFHVRHIDNFFKGL